MPARAPMQGMDALLLVSFGGPESHEEVMPFLQHVLAGRNVPHERMLQVAEHYHHFGGKSPIQDQSRQMVEALQATLTQRGHSMPVFWGNRHAQPFIADTLARMADAGVTRAFAFVTSAYSSYSGCRQYREALDKARVALGERAPKITILRRSFDHPRFVAAWNARVSDALSALPETDRHQARFVFTAHSIPSSMAAQCDYVAQLRAVSAQIADAHGRAEWDLVYQSRSGPPQVPWLAPDIGDHLRDLHARGERSVVVIPVGFLSDHMEVAWDLDVQARSIADELGVTFTRAGTPGTHPEMVNLVVDLLEERLGTQGKRTLGVLPARPDDCATDCCPAPARAS